MLLIFKNNYNLVIELQFTAILFPVVTTESQSGSSEARNFAAACYNFR